MPTSRLTSLAQAALVLLSFTAVRAVPVTSEPELEARDAAPVQITAAAIAAFKPYTYYAAAAYCDPATTLVWDCGGNCVSSPHFTPTAAGGDGNGVQFWYVGYDSSLKSIIVAHQGTDPTQFLSVLTDAQVWQTSLPTSRFPGLGALYAHDGFIDAQGDTSTPIRTAVTSATSRFNTTKVTFVGHSLGGAIALLDAVYFKVNFPSLTIAVRTYGMPRVGDQAFVNWVDANLKDQVRITNTEDPIPIVPGRFMGYKHPSGEVHIVNPLIGTTKWYSCAGQDNTSPNCSIGDTPNVFGSNILDHLGPYDGLSMGLCWLNGKK